MDLFAELLCFMESTSKSPMYNVRASISRPIFFSREIHTQASRELHNLRKLTPLQALPDGCASMLDLAPP